MPCRPRRRSALLPVAECLVEGQPSPLRVAGPCCTAVAGPYFVTRKEPTKSNYVLQKSPVFVAIRPWAGVHALGMNPTLSKPRILWAQHCEVTGFLLITYKVLYLQECSP